MDFNIKNAIPTNNTKKIDENLGITEETLKEIIRTSIEELKNNPENEKELITLWAGHINTISNYLFEECERTGNKTLGKNIMKYIMFNR